MKLSRPAETVISTRRSDSASSMLEAARVASRASSIDAPLCILLIRRASFSTRCLYSSKRRPPEDGCGKALKKAL